MAEKLNMKVPILYYNEPENSKEEPTGVDLFPYIEVAPNEEFPRALFIQEWRETGEYEITNEGDMPIVERDIKLFINADIIKSAVDESSFEKIKVAAGFPERKRK